MNHLMVTVMGKPSTVTLFKHLKTEMHKTHFSLRRIYSEMYFSLLHHEGKKKKSLNCKFITKDTVGNPSKGKLNKGSSLMSRSIEAWVMHACT